MEPGPAAAGAAIGTIFVTFLVINILFGLIPAFIAKGRGHNFWLFLLLSILVSWILALILAFVITPPPGARRSTARSRRMNRNQGRGQGSRRSTGRNQRRPGGASRNPYAAPRAR